MAGVVENVNVNLGDTIARGDKLARIESKVFELAVKQRQGQLSEIQARIKDAQKDVNRKKQLIETGAVSQAEYDVAVTQLNALSDQAEVAEAHCSTSYRAFPSSDSRTTCFYGRGDSGFGSGAFRA